MREDLFSFFVLPKWFVWASWLSGQMHTRFVIDRMKSSFALLTIFFSGVLVAQDQDVYPKTLDLDDQIYRFSWSGLERLQQKNFEFTE